LLVNIDHIQRINELAGGAIGTTLLALLHVADLLLQFGGKFEYYPRGFGVNGLPGGGPVFCGLLPELFDIAL
jgi:hypothetical protein